MERYDYREAVKDDILEYVKDNGLDLSGFDDEDWEALEDRLFSEDSVTGNASGSYTFNTWKAEENLCHNLGLLKDAFDEFGQSCDILDNPEGCDVTIRCWLLGEILAEIREEYENK